MRASFADFTFCEVRLIAPIENAAASEVEDEDVDGRSGRVGDCGIVAELVLCEAL